MDVKDAILTRKSVRSYKENKVPQEKLEEIMDSVRMAPSANNKQDWKFVIVEDEEKVYQAAKKQNSVKEASAVIAGVSTNPDEEMTCEILSGNVDLAIALDHLSLRAAEEGLGTCWIEAFHQKQMKKILEIPDEYKIICMMTIGYPKEPLRKAEKDRKSLEEIITYDSF